MFIKVSYNGIRKLRVEDNASFATLQAEILRAYGDKAKALAVAYVDSDNEVITIANEEDWKLCIEESQAKNEDKKMFTVNIKLIESEFETIGCSGVTVQDLASEIKEEPISAKLVESLPEGKTIVEVNNPPSIFEEEAPKVEEAPKPEEPKVELNNFVNNITEALNAMGINVEAVSAHMEEDEEEDKLNSSTLTTEQKDEIESLIEQKIAKAMNLNKAAGPKEVSAHFVHRGIICDGCSKSIANMARYKSLVKPNYDLCEVCERKGIHPEPMVRFATPADCNNWALEGKFRQMIPLFAKNDNKETQPECEGFRFPRRHPFGGPRGHGCPFKRHSMGGKNPWANFIPSQEQMEGHPLAGIMKMVPDFLENIKTGFMKNCPMNNGGCKKEEPKTEVKIDSNSEVEKVVNELVVLCPNVDRKILEEVVKTQGFKNAQDAYNFLFN